MTTVVDGRSETVSLPAGQALTVVSTLGAGRVTYRTDGGFVAVAAGATSTFGPYATPKELCVEARDGDLTYSIAPVDFPSLAEALAAAVAAALLAHVPVSGTVGDVKDFIGAGAPVDYTDGTPPATGEGVAGIGSRYTDTTAGALYINTGTKAHPLWTQLAPVE